MLDVLAVEIFSLFDLVSSEAMPPRPAVPGMHQLLPGDLQPGAQLHWQQASMSGRMLLSRGWPESFRNPSNCWFSFDWFLPCRWCSACVSVHSGLIFENGACVTPSDCPCEHRGSLYPSGETLQEECNNWWAMCSVVSNILWHPFQPAPLPVLCFTFFLLNLIFVPLSPYSAD